MKNKPVSSKIFAVLTVLFLFIGLIFKLNELFGEVGNYLLCFSIAFAVAIVTNNVANHVEKNRQTESV